MENMEYLNEETFQKNKTKVKKLGKILLIVGVIVLILGLILLILGFVNFGSNMAIGLSTDNMDIGKTAGGVFEQFGLVAIGGFFSFAGFILICSGGIVMFIAHRREIIAFGTQQVMPVAKEGIEKITPTVSFTAKEIAKGIKEGINEANQNINK